MVEKAILECGDCRIDLPVMCGSDGVLAVDVTSLYKDTKILTYDPGFVSTAACKSEITFIDGDKGVLRYRGHDIADLAVADGGFCSVAYLLLHGTIPKERELADFIAAVGRECHTPAQVVDVIQSLPRDAHPMAILIASFAALAARYHGANSLDPLRSAIVAISQVPGIVATIYRHTAGLPLTKADPHLGYVQNFVGMMFGDLHEVRRGIICRALEAIFIMHADHEQNASTATVRATGSAGANLFACLSAGAATLWGPAHGGANEAVVKMLEEIGNPARVGDFLEKVKDKESGVRLMGFGHRVYKNYDPRARVIRDICRETLNGLGASDPLLDVAVALEKAALEDEYFVKRSLYPNVDFYSGIVLKAIGVPVNMFTAFFALARTTGWSAQWYEMVTQQHGGHKICRPRQLYTGKMSAE
ncbi:citrate synthase [Anaplasma centrale str. Israel]|uniref:Citrate synthase n=1 Tax=Anaplasma centrale (strain Israel) TaxID=574556 RepID=D1ATK7_ANACI|nr:citrate synthase [Anaplasma centrale]ACZ48885.1 citrate synthase [Anaplasma centrale str. Israel]